MQTLEIVESFTTPVHENYQIVDGEVWKVGEGSAGPAYDMLMFNEYQQKSKATAVYPEGKNGLYYCALKLAGEAGEVAEHIGKAIRDDNCEITEERRAALRLELGDVLWYVSALCTELDLELSDVAHGNLDKLADRKARGVLGGSGDYR
jgi:NTP pyrophosphatase (non-canonical NTP hydrolase)